ncbi:MAG: ABC transporter permease [Clostridiales bacterium]
MLKIVKKTEVSSFKAVQQSIIAVFCALLATSVIILCMGYNPLEMFGAMINGSLLSVYRFQETIHKAIPLVVISLGVAIAFKMKFWNIGAEGQFYMGAFAATYFALNYAFLPKPILLLAMAIAAIISGGIWCFIPGLLKAKLGTNETLVTLMMNYIAIKWITYLQYGPWKNPAAAGFPRIAPFDDVAVLPRIFGVHIGWIIALVLAVLVYIFLKKTKLGYEITVVGENVSTAKYAGMNITKILLIAVTLSGAICGLAGMIQASAIERSLTYQMSDGIGFTAIITCWLAKLNPFVIIFVSFFFAILIQGGNYIQVAMSIPAAVAQVLQGIILFFVLGSEFFTGYKIIRVKNSGEESNEVAE